MRKILNYAGIFLAISIVIILLWKSIEFYVQLKKPISEPVALIPEQSSGFLSIGDFNTVFPQIQSIALQNTLDILFPDNKFREEIYNLKHLSDKLPFMKELMKKNQLYISFSGSNSLSLLKAESINSDDFHKALLKQKSLNPSEDNGQKYQLIKIALNNKTYYLTIFQSVILVSQQKSIIAAAINEAQNPTHFSKQEQFLRIQNTAGKNVPANLFLNLKRCLSQFNTLSSLNLNQSKAQTWLSFDLYPDNQNINGNGFLYSNSDFFNSFSASKELSLSIPDKIVQTEPASLYSFSVHEIKGNSQKQNDIPEAFYEGWTGNFGWLFSFENQGKLFWISAIECTDSLVFFQKLSNLFPESEITKTEKNRFKLRKPITLFSEKLEGTFAFSIEHIYLDKGILYFAGNTDEMDAFIRQSKSKNVLSENSGGNNILFQSRTSPFQHKSHFPDYIRNSQAVQSIFPDSISSLIFSISGRVKSLVQISFALSSLQKTNITESEPRKSSITQEKEPADYDYKVSLNNEVTAIFSAGERIFVQDKQHLLTIMDKNANIIGSLQLSEPVSGDILYLESGERNKGKYLLNTATKLYRFNVNGELTLSYPKQLPENATSGLLAIDYDKNSQYRLFYFTNNHTLQCITLDGKKLTQWNNPKLSSKPVNQPEHIVSGNKDYLIARDENGKTYFFDRKGKERVTPTSQFTIRTENQFHTDKLNLQCCDIAGNIVRIDETGLTTRRKPDFPYNSPLYLYAELDNNDQPEHIFAARNLIRAFNERKNLFFECVLSPSFKISKIYALKPGSKTRLFAYSENLHKLIEIDKNGEIIFEISFPANTSFNFHVAGKEISIVFGTSKKLFIKSTKAKFL
jgi:hypothetical protein